MEVSETHEFITACVSDDPTRRDLGIDDRFAVTLPVLISLAFVCSFGDAEAFVQNVRCTAKAAATVDFDFEPNHDDDDDDDNDVVGGGRFEGT